MAYAKFAVRRGDFALAGAAVAVSLSGSGGPGAGTVERCGIGLFGLGPTALRSPAAEALVTGAAASDMDANEVGRAAMAGRSKIAGDGGRP